MSGEWVKATPQYQAMVEVNQAIEEAVEMGMVPAEGIIWGKESPAVWEHRKRMQERGFWRSPEILSTCSVCGKGFVLRVWTEEKPVKFGGVYPIVDSEGGIVFDGAEILVDDGNVSWSWVVSCDDCSPL
jgi:hypothetical protein